MKARELLLRSKQIGLEADKAAEEEKETPEEKPEEAETPEPEEKEESSEENEAADDGDSEDEAEQPESEEESKDDESAEVEAEENDDVAETATDDSAPADTADSADDVPSDASDDEVGEETEETTVPVEGDVDSSVGADEKEILDLNGFEITEDDAEEVIDEVSTATDALESIYVNIQQSLATGGLTRQAYGFATDYANQVCKSVGLESVTTGLESADTRVQMSVAAMESIKDKITDGIKAVVEFLAKLYDMIISKLASLKSSVANTLVKIADKLKQLKDENFQKKIGITVSYFTINGKVTSSIMTDFKRAVDILDDWKSASVLKDVLDLNQKLLSDLNTGNKKYDDYVDPIVKAAESAYSELDKLFKFDKTTHLTTTILAGKKPFGLQFDSDASPVRNVIVEVSETAEVRSELTTLKALGIKQADADLYAKIGKVFAHAIAQFEDESQDNSKAVERFKQLIADNKKYDNDESDDGVLKALLDVQRLRGKFLKAKTTAFYCVSDAVSEVARALDLAAGKE